MERGVDDLVAAELPRLVGDRHVADLPTPALDERHHDALGHQDGHTHLERAFRQLLKLLADKADRVLDLEPADVRPRKDITGAPRAHRHVAVAVDALGKVGSHVASQATGAGGRAHETDLPRDLLRDAPGILEPRHHRRRLPEQVHGTRGVPLRGVQPRDKALSHRFVDVEAHAAHASQVPAESIPAQERAHVQVVAADAPAERGRGQIADIARESTEIADVVRQSLQLERDAANELRLRRGVDPGQGFHGVAVRGRVTERRVAGERLHVVHGPGRRTADEVPLDAPVLVAERDLEVEHRLPVALEAKVARLDDPRVHGPDRHLVHLVALDPVVVHHSDHGRPGPRLDARGRATVRGMEPNGLQPRVPPRHAPVLLGNLALEQVHLRAIRRQRLEDVGLDPGPGEEQRRRVLLGQYRVELHEIAATLAVSRVAEQRRHSPLPTAGLDHDLPELLVRQLGDFAHRDGFAILDRAPRPEAHRRPPT